MIARAGINATKGRHGINQAKEASTKSGLKLGGVGGCWLNGRFLLQFGTGPTRLAGGLRFGSIMVHSGFNKSLQ
jgi:hypothetical protein